MKNSGHLKMAGLQMVCDVTLLEIFMSLDGALVKSGKYLQMDFDELKRQSVGCSDSKAYSGEFSTAHIAVISVLAIIGALILVGTAMDLRDDKNPAVFYQILTAFSLRENIKFVFESPAKGGSARFGCLEGMRSLSMTW